MKCNLCPRRCNVDRSIEKGYCKMGDSIRVARAALHFGEEPPICSCGGSGTVFFSGCSLGCVYCQNAEISHEGFGKDISVNRLCEIFYELERLGAENINLVSPTHFVDKIKRALDIYKPKIPIIYNSSGYERVETLRSLEGYVDIYLIDFKYDSAEKALEYSGAYDYPNVVKPVLMEAYRQQGECIFDERGMLKKGLIVRHLLLPQATASACNIFDWVKENTPKAYISLMSQYVPMYNAREHKIIGRRVTAREYNKVLDYVFASGFENCYIQDITSANEKYIPSFDLTGV